MDLLHWRYTSTLRNLIWRTFTILSRNISNIKKMFCEKLLLQEITAKIFRKTNISYPLFCTRTCTWSHIDRNSSSNNGTTYAENGQLCLHCWLRASTPSIYFSKNLLLTYLFLTLHKRKTLTKKYCDPFIWRWRLLDYCMWLNNFCIRT